MRKVGFIGLGAMGRPMAANLLQAGYSLTVYDVVESAVAELTAKGATSGLTPRQVAEAAEVIITMLPNNAIVEAVLSGDDGLLAGSRPGQTIVDMSSVTPGHTKKMAALAEGKGVEYIDAPVSGGVAGAVSGNLTIMAGGKPEVLENCREILAVLGKKIYHVGPVGSGDTVKLVNNLLLGINMAAVAEAMTLGVKAGLDPQIMYEVIAASSGRSYALEAKVPGFVLKGNFEPGFAVDLQYKDLEMASQTGKELGLPLLLTNVAGQVYETARAKGLGRKDISAVVTMQEELAGVKVRT
jgi:2-hydroxymethylglutarate dehydrogenase